jgi:hypothetical protein
VKFVKLQNFPAPDLRKLGMRLNDVNDERVEELRSVAPFGDALNGTDVVELSSTTGCGELESSAIDSFRLEIQEVYDHSFELFVIYSAEEWKADAYLDHWVAAIPSIIRWLFDDELHLVARDVAPVLLHSDVDLDRVTGYEHLERLHGEQDGLQLIELATFVDVDECVQDEDEYDGCEHGDDGGENDDVFLCKHGILYLFFKFVSQAHRVFLNRTTYILGLHSFADCKCADNREAAMCFRLSYGPNYIKLHLEKQIL